MEVYLNIAEWGPNGEFGVEAGSRAAFNRSAQDLGYREAALLAAVLPNPRKRSASRPGPGVRRLAAMYERRAHGAGPLTGCLRRLPALHCRARRTRSHRCSACPVCQRL